MDFRVLGPLQVSDGDGPVALGGPKPQTVLAVLLAHAGQRVSTDRLIDEIYGESPPDAARTLRLEDPDASASVDFSEDGLQLLVAGGFGVRVYEVDTENLIDLAESRLLRSWTPEECFQYLSTEDCPAPG